MFVFVQHKYFFSLSSLIFDPDLEVLSFAAFSQNRGLFVTILCTKYLIGREPKNLNYDFVFNFPFFFFCSPCLMGIVRGPDKCRGTWDALSDSLALVAIVCPLPLLLTSPHVAPRFRPRSLIMSQAT
jgi:hypothetical protein